MSNRAKKVMVVMVAARMSLTGSARNTPNTGFGSRCGRMKMSGINRMILRRQAKVSLLLACLRKLILLIPLIFILPHVVANPVFGVFLAEPVSDIIAAAVTATTFFLQFNKILDKGAGRV